MSDEQASDKLVEAFKEGYKAAEKDIPLEKVLENVKGASA